MNRKAFASTRRAALSRIGTLLTLLALMIPGVARSQDVVINEIMAANATIRPLTTATNYQPDYVELYNRTDQPIDLNAGGWAISDKRDPKSNDYRDFYRFPPGTIIPGNGYLLVFFDDKTNNAGIHATFKIGTNETFTLRAGGDWVHLVKDLPAFVPTTPSAFTRVDSKEFGPQITDRAIGSVPDGDTNYTAWTLILPSPNGGSLPQGTNTPVPFLPSPAVSNEFALKINEWLALNVNDRGEIRDDWFEIYNPDSNNIVSMGGMAFVDRGSDPEDLWDPENQLPKLSFIGPSGYVVIIADADDNAENNNPDDPDVVDFSLSSSGLNGDFISMRASTNEGSAVIDIVGWTAPLVNAGLARGRVPDGSTNILVMTGTSPGERNFGSITEIVISEVLPHTDPPLEDAIELQNISSNAVDISHWWLTNDPDVPKKFRIPTNTIVQPGGFVVFYEGRGLSSKGVGFNKRGTGNTPEFTLNSARGDQLYLYKGRPDGSVTGERRGIDFGPSQNGISFARYVTSQTNADYVATSRSFGQDNPTSVTQFRLGTGKTNPPPTVGPIVITEIFYNPHLGGLDNERYEFIEIRNISDEVVRLYDPLTPANRWRLKDGVDFTFPANFSMQPDEYVLIVGFDPTTNTVAMQNFTNINAFPNIPPGTRILGPFENGSELGDSGERVELAWPDRPQTRPPDIGLVPYIVMDRVEYDDETPWNSNTDGSGGSHQRIVESNYGNDAANWKGEFPTPGRYNSSLELERPRITGHPKDQTVKERFNTTLSVRVRGGESSLQWYFNGTNLVDATNTTLQFIGVSTNDAGSYHVIASNTSGSATSLVATLTVTPTPADLTRPTITITSPAAGARLTTSEVVLTGTASDNTGIRRVEYRMGANNFLTATGLTVWGAPLTLEPGTNVITARAVDTSDNALESKQHKLIYVAPDELDLSVTGNGTVAGATDGQLLEVGRNYTLTATPATGSVFSNWTGGVSGISPKLTFRMESNLVVVANFVPNPFSGTAGKYNGLFYDPNGVEHFSSGFFNLSVTDRGTYSASITAAGKKLRAAGAFTLDGRATNVINRTGTNSLTVEWALQLDGSDRVSGLVTNVDWTAELAGDRAVFGTLNPYTNGGKFTFVIHGTPADTTAPEGDSYGTVSVDAKGTVSYKGFLADKTTTAQKVPVSKNGEWPFFVSLYSGKGSILGWITNVLDGAFEGDVNWSKPALSTQKYYKDGFNNTYTMIGSRYTAPVGTNRVLDITDALVTFTGGNLLSAFTNEVDLGLSSRVTNNTPTNRLVLTFVVPTGLFKGSVTPAGTTRAIPFAGAVIQRGTNASGYFLGTNQSGRVLFEAAPLP